MKLEFYVNSITFIGLIILIFNLLSIIKVINIPSKFIILFNSIGILYLLFNNAIVSGWLMDEYLINDPKNTVMYSFIAFIVTMLTIIVVFIKKNIVRIKSLN